MTKNALSFIALMLIMSGCASTTEAVTVAEEPTADGRQVFVLECSRGSNDWDTCAATVADRCGEAGYEILDRSNTLKEDKFGQTIDILEMRVACK
jgi:hypothetical protein